MARTSWDWNGKAIEVALLTVSSRTRSDIVKHFKTGAQLTPSSTTTTTMKYYLRFFSSVIAQLLAESLTKVIH